MKMRSEKIQKAAKDPVNWYLLSIAAILFLYISFSDYTQFIYEQYFIFPCFLFLGAAAERAGIRSDRKRKLLPIAMVLWFFFLQGRRFLGVDHLYNGGLFLSTYLVAYPMADLLNDGNDNRGLKLLTGAYLAGAGILAVNSILLVLDWLPEVFTKYIFWNGDRLEVFWHPNMAAFFFMVGIILCTTFFSQAKRRNAKLGLMVLLAMLIWSLSLTNCRTAIVLTGIYLGVMIFFWLLRRSNNKKWIIPGVLAVVLLAVVIFTGSGKLYNRNSNRLTNQQLPQNTIQTVPQETATKTEENTSESTNEITTPAETKPVQPPDQSIRKTDSPQGSILTDLGTLNNRTKIWAAALTALKDSRKIQLFGVGRPGEYVSEYFGGAIPHVHNSWLECFLGLGLFGFLMAVTFTLTTLWNIFFLLLRENKDPWKRNTALLTLCILAASFLEPYIFYTTSSYHPMDFLFFLCAGYLSYWQKEENKRMLSKIQNKIRKTHQQ